MKRLLLLSFVLTLSLTACFNSKTKMAPVGPEIKKMQDLVSKASYDDALSLAKEYAAKTPQPIDTDQALYLEGYILAFDKSDLQDSRPPLRELLKEYPHSDLLIQAQKLIADSQYWQGHYHGAVEEYQRLEAMGNVDLALYSKLQIGNCLLLDDKVSEALVRYKDLMDKNPDTSIAESAQLMTANAYLKLQNTSQAKKELTKLIAKSKNHDIQESAQKALRQIEEEASFERSQHKNK